MSKKLFLRIMNEVEAHDDYFVQKRNAAHILGLSCFQKVTAAMRMLTYGLPTDAIDEYIRIGESTALESLRKFVAAVVDIFEDEYLRYPNEKDTTRLLALGEKKGFLGMLGCIDCMHWTWKNCKQGQYKGHVDKPTSSWRQLLRTIFGSGMPSSGCLARTMTSMSFTGPLCLQTWQNAQLHRLIIQLMGMNIRWGIILQTEYTHRGLH